MVMFGEVLALMFMGLVLYVIGVHFIFFLRRRGWLAGPRPTHRGLANAYLHLQGLVQPEKQYVLEETEAERQEEDDEGGPDDPTAHLKRRSGREHSDPNHRHS